MSVLSSAILRAIPNKVLFFNLSKKGLGKRNRLSKNAEFDESIHLKDLEKNLENGCSPADSLINKFNFSWKRSVTPVYKELIF